MLFQIKAQRPRYRLGEPVDLSFSLTNRGNSNIRINRRFLVFRPAPHEHDIVVTVQGPQGYVPFASQIHTSGLRDRHFVDLAPGQSWEEVYPLSTDFDLTTGGTYRIRALYSSSDPRAWTGTILSESEVEVTID